jgi:hypothetical protein
VHAVWAGRCAQHCVDLVGTVPASLSAYLACQAFKPDLVISAGTAGGFKAQVCGWVGGCCFVPACVCLFGRQTRSKKPPEKHISPQRNTRTPNKNTQQRHPHQTHTHNKKQQQKTQKRARRSATCT